MKIYAASSWRNPHYDRVIELCIAAGHEPYNFRNPVSNPGGFHWSEVEPNYERWTVREYRDALSHEVARVGFEADYRAMFESEATLLVNPCGRSAHLELGWALGAGKIGAVYFPEGSFDTPDLMYKLCGWPHPNMGPEFLSRKPPLILIDEEELKGWLKALDEP